MAKKYSDYERRLYNRMRKELGWSAYNAGQAIQGLRIIDERDWDYTWQDDYNEVTEEQYNRIILLDQDGEELGWATDFTYSDIGQAAEAGMLAYLEDVKIKHGLAKTTRTKRCPPGEIERSGYTRKGYTRKDGTRVKKTRVPAACIPDQGKPGKGPIIVPELREGKLGGPGYTDKSATERHKILDKCVKKWGYKSCLGSLQYLLVVGKREMAAGKLKKIADDKKWLMNKYGKKGNPELTARDAKSWIGCKIGKYLVDDVAKVKGRWVFYFRNEEDEYVCDWLEDHVDGPCKSGKRKNPETEAPEQNTNVRQLKNKLLK